MLPRIPKHLPDPAKAHGAWVYLLISILAGALSVAGHGFLPALLAGLGFAGIFLLSSAAALWRRPGWVKRAVIGFALAAGSPALALAFDADPNFFAYALVAMFPAAAAVWFAITRGFMSPSALVFAVAALVVAAPSAACAGGGTAREGVLLALFLTPFFMWRTWLLRVALSERKGWTRAELRRQGLREAGIAVGWTVLAVVAIHLLPR